MFEALGINKLTEAVYLEMLQHPEADIVALGERLGLTEEQVREALDDLARMSLLRASWADPEALRPVDPEVGLSMLLAREEADLARRQQDIEESRAAFTLLMAEQAELRGQTTSSGVERLEGMEVIRHRIRELAQGCRWEASSFMPGGAQSAASLEASRALDADAVERGVRLRTVYLDSVRNDPATLDYARWLAELGGEVRTVPALPLRLLIVDRDVAVVPVSAADDAPVALVVTTEGLLTALVALFQTVWKQAAPLGSARRRDDEGLSPQERQVLILLGEGHTDERIARRLGVSVRTTRRIAADLLTRLGARSRFQAGALAVTRGWIDESDLG
ncbi:helix-turn-helix transcriptional regulator [Micromonospora mirobrigensis]|uniref:Regulatory protein, luxR family n=1 Tax=Micromonospora mirobrigensis TaxID=262898 RepID=A0A1C4WPM5_9ACTN|nr:LuxR family transcriptional regulator [Micromonospora mirobrigensis]SCE98236.1 regulatory protein, luxR family [Micromonospora mirobrigensis]